MKAVKTKKEKKTKNKLKVVPLTVYMADTHIGTHMFRSDIKKQTY